MPKKTAPFFRGGFCISLILIIVAVGVARVLGGGF